MKDTIFFKQARLLVTILPHIEKEKIFALKGGTAINYFHRNLPRFSVDIDLAFLPIKSRKETLLNISAALNRITEDIKRTIIDVRINYKIDTETNLTIGLTVNKKSISVKLEPNIVLRGSVYQPEIHSFCNKAQELFESNVSIQTLSFADLYGGKICAALDRQHPRDLFDIKLLFENEGFTEKIRKAFIVYLISHPRPISELLNPRLKDFRKIFENEFKGMTLETVNLEELLSLREKLVKSIAISLSSNEKMFLITFKEMKPNWELLNLENIKNLPAVKWKLINLSQMDPKKHRKALEKLKSFLDI